MLDKLARPRRSSTSPIKLTDFSLACFFFEPTEPGGTPEFMVPELVSDPDGMAASGWGPEVDMWAVGILIFWMLCGRTPFDDDNIPQILQNTLQVCVLVVKGKETRGDKPAALLAPG